MNASVMAAWFVDSLLEFWIHLNDMIPFDELLRAGVLLTVGFMIVKLVDSVFGIGLAVGKKAGKESKDE